MASHLVDSPIKHQRHDDGEDVILPEVHLGEALVADEDSDLPQCRIALLLDVGKARLAEHLDEFSIELILGIPLTGPQQEEQLGAAVGTTTGAERLTALDHAETPTVVSFD